MNLRLNRIPNPRVLREVNLWPPVKAWLEAQGFTPHAEVFGHDIVAIRGEELWVIELKMCATYHAFNQASRGFWIADKVYVATGSTPRATAGTHDWQREVGIVSVASGVAVLVRECTPMRERQSRTKHDAIVVAMRNWKQRENDVAGKPNLRGEGPAQALAPILRAFFECHPGATWRDAFAAVPNHYAHFRSLQQHQRGARHSEALTDPPKCALCDADSERPLLRCPNCGMVCEACCMGLVCNGCGAKVEEAQI